MILFENLHVSLLGAGDVNQSRENPQQPSLCYPRYPLLERLQAVLQGRGERKFAFLCVIFIVAKFFCCTLMKGIQSFNFYRLACYEYRKFISHPIPSHPIGSLFRDPIGKQNLGQFWNFTTGTYAKYCIQTRLLFVSITTPRNLKTNVSVGSLNSWNTTVLSLSEAEISQVVLCTEWLVLILFS